MAAAPEREFTTERYIGREYIPDVLSWLQTGDVFLVIRRPANFPSSITRFCDHMGVIVCNSPERVDIVHSIVGGARQEPLLSLMARYPSIMGFKFLRLRPDAAVSAKEELVRIEASVLVPQSIKEDQRLAALSACRSFKTEDGGHDRLNR